MTEEELAKRKKINKRILIIGVITIPIIAIIASRFGEKSVKDLNNYDVYSLFASENEKDGSVTNRIEYYVCNGNFDLKTLAELCKKKKNIYRNSTTFAGYYMVLFKNGTNVQKSKYPIGAMYGDEFEILENILAFYTFGGPHGITFSEIAYYEKNAKDSVAKKIDVK